MVYGSCVIIANIILVHKFNLVEKGGVFFICLMIFSFFFFLFLESDSGLFPNVSHIFGTMFKTPLVWLTMVISLGTCSAIEIGYRAWNKIIRGYSVQEKKVTT